MTMGPTTTARAIAATHIAVAARVKQLFNLAGHWPAQPGN